MQNPCFIMDLKPTYPILEQGYLMSGARLISPFQTYMDLITNMFKAMHNDTSEDEVLIDHYLNGSYVTVTPEVERAVRAAVCAALDSIITIADIHGSIFPGKIRTIFIEYTAWIMVIEYGGENDTA